MSSDAQPAAAPAPPAAGAPTTERVTRPRVAATTGLAAASLLLLAVFSLHLARERIYQVDEAQNLYMARVVGAGETDSRFTTAALWLLAFARLAAGAPSSETSFAVARLVFLAVFWLNLLLLGHLAGGGLRTRKGFAALLGAATLAPLWDYGLEARHDNLVLLGVLLIWWAVRRRPGARSWALAGLVGALLLFAAFKSFVFVLPLWALLLAFPRAAPGKGRAAPRLALLVAAGLALLAVRLLYARLGLWDVFVQGVAGGYEASTGSVRFGPWLSVQRLPHQTPLLLAALAAAAWIRIRQFGREGRAALAWDGPAPDCALLLVALGAFLANPTPFPCNLVTLVPFAWLFVFPVAWERLNQPFRFRPALVGALVLAHALPFAVATVRHLDRPNARQRQLLALAERLTAPQDPVFDGIGLVLARPVIHRQWYLHSLNIERFRAPQGPHVRDLLAASLPPVLIPSYRTDWLPEEDLAFVRAHYVPLADDFRVLGAVLPRGGGEYEVRRPGRYRLAAFADGRLVPLVGGTLDGRPAPSAPFSLPRCTVAVRSSQDQRPVVAWIGPTLQEHPPLAPSRHEELFVNWY